MMDDLMNRKKALFEIGKFYELGETPSKEAIEYIIHMLDKEPCEDCISKQAAIDALRQQAETMSEWSNRYAEQRKGILTAVNIVDDLSFVQPEPFINKPCISEGVCHEDKMKVLDKVRSDVINIADGKQSIKVRSVLRIIDKYMKESEDNK